MCARVRLVLTLATVITACCIQDGMTTRQFKRDIMYPNYNEPAIIYDGPSGYPRGPIRGGSGSQHGPRDRVHPHHRHPATGPQEKLAPGEIPLAFYKRLNEISDIEDFYALVKGSENITRNDGVSLGNRFGDDTERKSVVKPKVAKCMPEERTVALAVENPDPSLFYYPSCTRVKLCGGCCSTSIMSCQPTETQTIHFQVLATQYSGNNQMVLKSKEIVRIEEHTKCRCMCTVKEKDCNQFQAYRPNECRCDCTNVDERQKCMVDNDTKVWNPNNCACTCREIRDCSTGSVFNPMTCSCTVIPDRVTRRHAGNSDLELQLRLRRGDKSATKTQTRPVVPLQ